MKKSSGNSIGLVLLTGIAALLALWILIQMFPKYSSEVCAVTKVYATGAAKEMVFYKNKKKVATYYLDEQGSIVRTKGSPPNGLFKQYYPNGKLLSKDHYVNGRLSGLREAFHDSGVIQLRETYQNGKLNGIRKIYSERGRLACLQLFDNGDLEGLSHLYNSRGQDLITMPYASGKLNGSMTLYSAQKQVAAVWNYTNGALNGASSLFYGENMPIVKDVYLKGRLVSRKVYTSAQKRIFAQNAKLYPRGKRSIRTSSVALFLNYPAKIQDRLLTRYEGKKRVLGGFTYASKGRVTGVLKVYYPNGKPLFLENYKNGYAISREVYDKDGAMVYKESR